jgi:hypothetical protein
VPRPPNIIRPVHLKTSLPEDLRAWLDLHLWSDTEMRVPHGAYQRLIVQLLREYMERVEGSRNATNA